MDTVNITDATTWSSIDIFLFSNGQQYSPPRKYHLRTEELQWWEATVSYLGRTHYGCGHLSVDLYTIDGTKINGPLDLVNGAAYVAVEPPDVFIDTGYQEYLVKASRSWEKRLVQKTNEADISKLDEIAKTIDPRSNIVDEKINLDKDVIIRKGTPKTTDNINATPRPTKPPPNMQRKSNSATKQSQKKKSSDVHNGSVRKISTDTERNIPCAKKLSIGNNGQGIRKHSTLVPFKKFSCNNKRKSTTSNNECQDTIRSSLQIDEKKTNNSKKYQSIQGPYNEQNNQDTETIKGPHNSPTRKEETFLYNKKDNEQKSDIIDPEKDVPNKNFPSKIENSDFPMNDSIIPNGDKKQRQEEIAGEEFENYTANDILKNKDDTINQMTLDKQVSDEYIAYMNKGGILLLKFNLKIKDCKSLHNRQTKTNLHTTRSSSNLLKTEKISQADIAINFSAELLKADEELRIQDKSLQSLLNKIYTENIDNAKVPKIVVVQCACHDYSKNNEAYTRMCDKICKCNRQEGQNATLQENMIEKTPSCEYYRDQNKISRVNHNGKQEDVIALSAPNVNTDKLGSSQSCNVTAKYVETKLDGSERHNSLKTGYDKYLHEKRVSTDNNDMQPTIHERDTRRLNQKNKEYAIREDDMCSSSILNDKSTQTDWSNVLLEARRNEDDHYTFHLPSLYVIKRCLL